MSSDRIRLLSLMRPAMGIIPEVAPPERKVPPIKIIKKSDFAIDSAARKNHLDRNHLVHLSHLLSDPDLRGRQVQQR